MLAGKRFDFSFTGGFNTNAVTAGTNRVPGYHIGNARITWRSPNDAWEAALVGSNVFNEVYYISNFDLTASAGAEYGLLAPQGIGRSSANVHLHVENADAVIERAIAAGATLVRPASDAFYGERSGTVRDPFGHEWNIGHEIEKVTPEEMQRRYTTMMNEGKL